MDNATSWDYYAVDRVIQETNELSDSRYFEYDLVGNLTEHTDRNNRVIQFDYDNLYRLIGEQWLDNTPAVIYEAEYAYNAAGWLMSALDDYSQYAFTYDDLGRRTQIDNDGTPDQPNVEKSKRLTPRSLGNRRIRRLLVDCRLTTIGAEFGGRRV